MLKKKECTSYYKHSVDVSCLIFYSAYENFRFRNSLWNSDPTHQARCAEKLAALHASSLLAGQDILLPSSQ